MRLRFALLLLALVALCLVGCSSGMYPVEGQVRFADGRPATELAGGFVTFQSLAADISSQGVIDEEGRFRLSTRQENDGAYPGKYRVLVSPPPFHGNERQQAPEIVDRRYSDFQSSGLEATVEAKHNSITLNVRRGQGRAVAPFQTATRP